MSLDDIMARIEAYDKTKMTFIIEAANCRPAQYVNTFGNYMEWWTGSLPDAMRFDSFDDVSDWLTKHKHSGCGVRVRAISE